MRTNSESRGEIVSDIGSMEAYLTKDEVVEEVDSDGDNVPEDGEDDDEKCLNNPSNGQGAVGGDGNHQGEDEDDDNDDEEIEEDLEPLDEADSTFSAHKEPVLAVQVSTSGSFVVSGGQDDLVHIWNPKDASIIYTCTGHTDSIDAVGISMDESLVATADMGGMIQVWKNEMTAGKAEKWCKIFDYQVDDINWMTFHPVANSVLLVGTAVGTIWMFNSLDSSKVKTFQGTNVSCSSGHVTPDGTHLVSGYIDGSIRIWDLKSGSVVHCIKDKSGHSQDVNSIDIKKDLAATGSSDGTVKLINLTNGKVLATMATGKSKNSSSTNSDPNDNDSVEMVAFCGNQVLPVVASVTVSGCIDLWDLSSLQKRLSFTHEGGVSKMKWDLTETFKLITAGLDGTIKIWDARDGRILETKRPHYESILDFAISPSGLLVTASDDSSCKVFST